MRIEAWSEVADATVHGGDDQVVATMADALRTLGLSDQDRSDLTAEVDRRSDAAAELLRQIIQQAGPPVSNAQTGAPPQATESQMDLAIGLAERLEAEAASDAPRPVPTLTELRTLRALPPDRAGALALALTRTALESSPDLRASAIHASRLVGAVLPTSRLPVADLVDAALGASTADTDGVVRLLAAAPADRLLTGFATALSRYPDRLAVARLAQAVASRRVALAATERPSEPQMISADGEIDLAILDQLPLGPSGTAHAASPDPTPPAPPAGDLPSDLDAPSGRGPGAEPSSSTSPPSRSGPSWPRWPWRRRREDAQVAAGDDKGVVWRGGTPGRDEPERPAYARIDLATGTSRPDVVVVGTPFTATVGLRPQAQARLVSTGAIQAKNGDLEVVVAYDPTSLTPTGETRRTLNITDAEPYPTFDVTFTAAALSPPVANRRIGVHLLAGGHVVGVAWRGFVAVDEEARVVEAAVPPPRESELLDLTPLLDDDPPDLVLAVCRSDASDTTWVWSTYATDPSLPAADGPYAASLGDDVKAFALDARRQIQFSGNRASDWLDISGRARLIGAAIPAPIRESIARLVAAPGRTGAPSILLLTEELVIPWELAEIDGVTTAWGGASPFLGAHAAVGRWPLTEHEPRPAPRARVKVRSAAVLTADYTGVPKWNPLTEALGEAASVAALFTPAAPTVKPELWPVVDLFRGKPPANLVHVALHGQFDDQGNQGGIVLVNRDGTVPKAEFLTAVQLENGRLDASPFVFLNACQVGSDKQVLGSYGGFASTLLRIGASGVVAPLWNVDDDVAAHVAAQLYAAAWTAAQPVPVSEAMRAIRATYTEDSVRAGTPGVTATLVAFQVFGHPRLTLERPA